MITKRDRPCVSDYAKEAGLPAPDFKLLNTKGHQQVAGGMIIRTTRNYNNGLLMSFQAEHRFAGIVPCYGTIYTRSTDWVIWTEPLAATGYYACLDKFNGDPRPITEWEKLTEWVDETAEHAKAPYDQAARKIKQFSRKYPPMKEVCEVCLYFLEEYGELPGRVDRNTLGYLSSYDHLVMFDADMHLAESDIDFESCLQ